MQLKRIKPQSGATLIETLVALFVFAIGMLGMAALIATAMKYQTGNITRSQVAQGFDDIAERIRSNVTTASGYTSIVTGTTSFTTGSGYLYSQPYSTQVSSTPSYAINCMSTTCTQSQRADYDVAQWRLFLRQALPGGAGLISGNVSQGFDVTILWFDKDAVQGDDAEFGDTLLSNATCSGSELSSDPLSRFCCPEQAQAPAGVRCYNAVVVP